MSRPVRRGVLALQPFGEEHLRRDGGGGQNGTGVEVAFGLGLTGGIVRLDVQGRALAVHSAAGYGERDAGLTLTVGDRRREGLSLSVSPSWGDAASGNGAPWQEEIYRHYLSEKAEDAFAVDARGDYGVRLPNGGLLTWFGRYSHSPYDRRFVVGGSIGGLADARRPGSRPRHETRRLHTCQRAMRISSQNPCVVVASAIFRRPRLIPSASNTLEQGIRQGGLRAATPAHRAATATTAPGRSGENVVDIQSLRRLVYNCRIPASGAQTPSPAAVWRDAPAAGRGRGPEPGPAAGYGEPGDGVDAGGGR